ncbi:hypothetical protein DYB25_005099 [Aphanomyces astaci]|uniref:Uncharacterized protein n=1 Tax=Aphanomyces astaci TaxID=112090 RepID=A0A397CKG6_APHAT|nr:hypothetical protein DYB25_005099 [Aphanomyces astaci]RHY45163.1 hypothetical protein DYB38_010345 [Aphanomyces astaci]RHY57716.1 hypothetical protein DYB34_007525 [Aphanomyces astaci]RHY73647.1 hypothetical protein DYB30_007263 [Aphanomyces astaci]RHZ04614.1 hypothetical protein DYB31_000919 [Aphanomyces astaci]
MGNCELGMLKRYLTQIARKERLSVSAQDVAHIVESCRGDIRHAMNTLQFQRTTDSNSTSSNGGRDPFLSDFHVLGKILHRKGILVYKPVGTTSLYRVALWIWLLMCVLFVGASYHRDVRPYERWLPQTSSAAPTLLVSADDVDDEIVDSD